MWAGGYQALSLWLILWCAATNQVATADSAAAHAASQRLVGAWRLVSVYATGPGGRLADPFYQADSLGLIIYDSSGRMSVQIAAAHRSGWKMPRSRPPVGSEARELELKSAALDTYYAYFGTWEYDPVASIVTHHVETSLMPVETGLSYAQEVRFEGNRLIFTVRDVDAHGGQGLIHHKVWQRIANGPAGSPVK